MQWFKHDSNAHTDAKLRRVRMKYGLQGYGLYWYCLELIAQNIEAHNLTFELEHDAEIIAFDVGLSRELVEEMMRFMIEQGLFQSGDNGRIFCMKMLKRMDTSMTSNEKMRSLIKAAKDNHDAVMTGHDGVMTHPDFIMQERKKDKKEREGQKRKRFVPPTPEEVQAYASEKGYQIDAHRFVNFYESKGWMVGKNKMKSWTHAVANWAKGDGSSKGVRYI